VAKTRYVQVSLGAPGIGIVEAFQALFDILNKRSPGLGWEFAVPVDTSVFIVYRDVESDVELDDAVRALRERVGGLQYVREVDSPLR
jgi:hypothetical protein